MARRALIVMLIGLGLLPCALVAQATPDRVLFNARVFTADVARPYAAAVALRGERILAVGSEAEVSQAAGKDAEHIDLAGRFLMPGLIDSHCHALSGGLGLISADNDDQARSVAELATFAAEARLSGRGMRGGILYVSGVPLATWTQLSELDAHFNHGALAELPVALHGMDGHTAWINRKLLARAGIDRALLAGLDAQARQYYGVDSAGEPNGFISEEAIARVTALFPPPDAARVRKAGHAALAYLHGLGITAWLDPAADDTWLDGYRALSEAGELSAQVVALPVIDFKAGAPDEQLAKALRARDAFAKLPNVRVGGIKVFADGVVEYPTQTGHLSKPYRNSGLNGELLFRPADFARIATAADRAGMIVHVHAIGDQAVTAALDGIEAARRANGDSRLPHTITHLELIRPEDLPRFRALGVIASFQLYWARGANTTIDLLQPYIDPALYAGLYPARALLEAGGTIAGASDWSVSTANVFHAIHRAETREGPKGVLDARQRMPREAMLYAYTVNAARALGEEARIGSLAPGKQADLVLLDRDVLTVSAAQARDTEVLWTLVAGRTVYGGVPPSPSVGR
jgi:predicted amidohydrolase YtcJ